VALFSNATGPLPVAGTATAQDPKLKDVRLDVNAVHRDATGLTTLTWTLTNNGSDKFGIGYTFVAPGHLGTYDGLTVSGAALVDPAAKLTYQTLRDQLGGCLCTTLNSGKSDLAPGESAIYYTAYALPSGVATVTVTFPGFTAVTNVPVR
jgi:hypothetical protein